MKNDKNIYLLIIKSLFFKKTVIFLIFILKTNVSLNELVDMLDAYVDSYSSISVALRKFGIDFSLAIEKFKFTPEEIIKNSKYSFTPTYAMRIKEGVELSKVLDNITVIESEPNNELNDEDVQLELNPNRQDGGFNKIYYGIPGCGKSYTVDQEIRKVYPDKKRFEKNVFRTTFYLDYSNADFVGQLMPKTDKKGHVTYEPNFGPFTSALQRAFETTDMVYLVIEEINRGNAAAIFGDLFQLMDRLDQEKVELRDDGSKVGDSEYPITNTFIEDYLGIERGKVIIPSNLTIYATMNTSDQNVFPLDTAFKRRWKTQKIIDEYKTSKYHDYYIPQMNASATPVTWEEFIEKINSFIIKSEEGFNQEDKQIGSYFVKEDILVKDKDSANDEDRVGQFNHKVIDYLWSDVAKFERKRWVNLEKTKQDHTPYSFDELVELINKYGIQNTLNAFETEDEGE